MHVLVSVVLLPQIITESLLAGPPSASMREPSKEPSTTPTPNGLIRLSSFELSCKEFPRAPAWLRVTTESPYGVSRESVLLEEQTLADWLLQSSMSRLEEEGWLRPAQ